MAKSPVIEASMDELEDEEEFTVEDLALDDPAIDSAEDDKSSDVDAEEDLESPPRNVDKSEQGHRGVGVRVDQLHLHQPLPLEDLSTAIRGRSSEISSDSDDDDDQASTSRPAQSSDKSTSPSSSSSAPAAAPTSAPAARVPAKPASKSKQSSVAPSSTTVETPTQARIRLLDSLLAMDTSRREGILKSEREYLDLRFKTTLYLEGPGKVEADLLKPGGLTRLVAESRSRFKMPAAIRGRSIGPIVEGSSEDKYYNSNSASGLIRRDSTLYKPLDWEPSTFNTVLRQSSSAQSPFTIWGAEEKLINENACFVLGNFPCWRPAAEKVIMSTLRPFFDNGGTFVLVTAQSEIDQGALLSLLCWKKQIEETTPGRLVFFFADSPKLGNSNFHTKFQWLIDVRTGTLVTLSGSANATDSGMGFKARFSTEKVKYKAAGKSDEEIYVLPFERFADGTGTGWALLRSEESFLLNLKRDGRLTVGMPHLYQKPAKDEVDYTAVANKAMFAYQASYSNMVGTDRQEKSSRSKRRRIAAGAVVGETEHAPSSDAAAASPMLTEALRPKAATWTETISKPARANLDAQADMRGFKTKISGLDKEELAARKQRLRDAQELGARLAREILPAHDAEAVAAFAAGAHRSSSKRSASTAFGDDGDPSDSSGAPSASTSTSTYQRPTKQVANPGNSVAWCIFHDDEIVYHHSDSTPSSKDRGYVSHLRSHMCRHIKKTVEVLPGTDKTCDFCGKSFATSKLRKLHQEIRVEHEAVTEEARENGESIFKPRDDSVISLVEPHLPDGDIRGDWGWGYSGGRKKGTGASQTK